MISIVEIGGVITINSAVALACLWKSPPMRPREVFKGALIAGILVIVIGLLANLIAGRVV